jgi:thiosulfate reductase/polysulfide reductase chain A
MDKGATVGKMIEPLPVYDPIPDHQRPFEPDQLIMISFKWNVHNAHRTMQSKWLQEIVHTNPARLNAATARRLGLVEGDWIEVTSYRPRDSQVPYDDGSVVGKLKTRVHLTEGVHPSVIAISHNHGRWVGGPIASHSGVGASEPFPGFENPAQAKAPPPWWAGELSVAQNNLLPIYPDPRSGQQAYHDTVVRVRKLQV